MAQLAEQLICNQQVIGSSPIIGFVDSLCRLSIDTIIFGQIPEWPKGTDCKSAAECFGGSNPPLPIVIRFFLLPMHLFGKELFFMQMHIIYYRGVEQSGSSPGS